MKQVKMSDVFNLLKYANGKEIDTGELIDGYGNWWATFNSKQAAMHAATAINSYDQHVELIAKQAEQIKIVKNQIAKIIMLYKQSNLDSDTSMMASIELDELIESISATEQK